MKKMINNMKQRMNSDDGASYTIEIIFGIVLAVFAGLALYTFVLKPVQQTAANTGSGISKFTGDLMNSQGKNTQTFDGTQGKISGE